jgi:hypothetical protein
LTGIGTTVTRGCIRIVTTFGCGDSTITADVHAITGAPVGRANPVVLDGARRRTPVPRHEIGVVAAFEIA